MSLPRFASSVLMLSAALVFAQPVTPKEAALPSLAPLIESVKGAVAMSLRQQTYVTALRQYLQLLAGQALVEGVELDASTTPLVQ